MAELLRNAWLGWFRVTGEGKIMALFLVSLLFLWIGDRQEEQKSLLRYSTAVTICCILPVTAVGLMLYQTRFYDYEWIWSAVPVTIVTACAGTKVQAECWQGFRKEAWKRGLPVTIGLLAAALLCGGLGGAGADRARVREQKAEVKELLESVRTDGSDVCLWAPREIMEYARRLDGSILLPYGRNMWEEALNAYSYDAYPDEIQDMYRWMCVAEECCAEDDADISETLSEKMEEQEVSTGECLEAARRAGVNLLLLPENTNRVLLKEVMDFTGTQPEQCPGYCLFRL